MKSADTEQPGERRAFMKKECRTSQVTCSEKMSGTCSKRNAIQLKIMIASE